MKFRVLMAIALLQIPGSAFADRVCDDLWLSRNHLFDLAGQCFKSTLGQAVFDNRDCSTTAAKLSPQSAAIVANIREQERVFGCRTDTSRSKLELDLVGLRRQLRHVPVAEEWESGCIFYQGPAVALLAEARRTAAPIGTLGIGHNVLFSHSSPYADWQFVTTSLEDGTPVSLGWLPDSIDWDAHCRGLAG